MGRIKVGLASKDKSRKRSPGLFKEEFRGDRMIAFCSKCYIAMGPMGLAKTSAKGVNKRQNQLVWDQYFKALRDSQGGRRYGHLFTEEEGTFRLLR